jgi:hypothetical protein
MSPLASVAVVLVLDVVVAAAVLVNDVVVIGVIVRRRTRRQEDGAGVTARVQWAESVGQQRPALGQAEAVVGVAEA